MDALGVRKALPLAIADCSNILLPYSRWVHNGMDSSTGEIAIRDLAGLGWRQNMPIQTCRRRNTSRVRAVLHIEEIPSGMDLRVLRCLSTSDVPLIGQQAGP